MAVGGYPPQPSVIGSILSLSHGEEMFMVDTLKPQVRILLDWEKEQIQHIFQSSLDITKVRVCEGYSWPDFANRLGRMVRRQTPPGPGEHNSITLGNHCYFPVLVQEHQPPEGDWDISSMKWLAHELTHAWQYQHMGTKYLFRALWAQFRLKDGAYDYGGLDGLLACRAEGGNLVSFNVEAQASIVEDYYWRTYYHQDVSAYTPYIEDLQQALRVK